MGRKVAFWAVAVVAAASWIAVAGLRHASGPRVGAGCAVRYTSAPGGTRLTVSLQQPGSLEVRAVGATVTRALPAGVSVLTIPSATGAVSATEFTADGQLLVCVSAPGG